MALQKSNRRILIWSTLGVLLLILIFFPGPKKVGVEEQPSIPEAASLRVETAKISGEGENPPYIFDVEYPKLAGLGNERIMEAVNKDVKGVVDTAVAGFKGGLEMPPPEFKDTKNALTMRYEVGYANTDMLSVAIVSSPYIAGTAHPSTDITTLTYDLRSGKRVKLGDLFLPQSEYLKILSAYCIPRLVEMIGVEADDAEAMDWIETGAGSSAENYQNFLIAKEGLIIIFNQYQVAPGVAGSPRVAVPYALLEGITNTSGLLMLRRAEAS